MTAAAIPVPAKLPDESQRLLVTAAVMLATIMQALDTTIANVALPHMQGNMGATQDQISWVLTSYIVAAAICTPLTGFLSARWGRKRLFIMAVIGFTIASMLCGAAQNLPQIVLFRLLQGVFGASLVPLSQAVLLDSYPKEKHGSAMALWGIGVMVGPILGPSLGGWLTEYYNWRWVFYINLPFGILAWLGIQTFVKETPLDPDRKFDLFGFTLLSVGIGALQMMLDRGESKDWFASPEVAIEALLAGLCIYAFIAHIFTAKNAFIDPAIFKDKNFSIGLLFIFIIGIILLATMALLPPYLQSLMGYPVIDVGILLAPRGFGTLFAMFAVGRLSGKLDARIMISFGLSMTIISLWMMTNFTTDMSGTRIVISGIIQGFGLGFIWVPLSTLTFATLPAHFRTEGTALFSLIRNIGSSIGISAVITYLSERTQINHAAYASLITPFRPAIELAVNSHAMDLTTRFGLSMANARVSFAAADLAYLQDFRLMMWITMCAFPLLLLLSPPKKAKAVSKKEQQEKEDAIMESVME
ncbi:DHA2 family efflux MFS transporter permease subunit [Aestuariivirga litoralis]|uniref:DHA2 family efflux MFS transporter permease subunit n=1 Tax=Aestuariivirga litoralis TaxID=2650924 RepID=UPI0018C748ED|nr:DHA2 family efflux MFS transporter permease subunit [Aestuariivirga litoralis]MBG1231381.1 DHA2 family efflux MFS transporter permease subunit [Aestuariivirga litoralis]